MTDTNDEKIEVIVAARLKEMSVKLKDAETQRDEAMSKLTGSEKEREEFKSKYEQSLKDVERGRVASKYKLPAELAGRLKGETPEELEKDAEDLSKLFTVTNPGLKDTSRVDAPVMPTDDFSKIVQELKDKKGVNK